MRRSPTLDALFTVPRQGILAVTLMEPGRWWYLSDLARRLGVHHATLQRELVRLTSAGILVARRDGNRAYYRANDESPIFPELRAILAKTAGLVEALGEALHPFSTRIACAFVYGSVARAAETSQSDIDLMIIGDVALRDLAPALREAEEALGRQINPSLYRPAEFAKKLASQNHFLQEVLDKEKLFVVGSQNDLGGLAQGRPSRSSQARARRDRGSAPGG